MSCQIIFNSNTIELTVHISCYFLELTLCYVQYFLLQKCIENNLNCESKLATKNCLIGVDKRVEIHQALQSYFSFLVQFFIGKLLVKYLVNLNPDQ